MNLNKYIFCVMLLTSVLAFTVGDDKIVGVVFALFSVPFGLDVR